MTKTSKTSADSLHKELVRTDEQGYLEGRDKPHTLEEAKEMAQRRSCQSKKLSGKPNLRSKRSYQNNLGSETKRLVDRINLPNMTENLLSRIAMNAGINHGKPSIRCTRYMVVAILEYLAGGDTIDAVLVEFPDLERTDIFDCIAYGTHCQTRAT